MAQDINTNNSANEAFNVIDFLFECLRRWYAFVLSIVLMLLIAVLYIARTHPTYSASSTLVIKQDRRGGSSGMENSLSNLANMGSLFSQQTNVYNEILAFQSHDFMEDVINKLDLKSNYTTRHHLYNKVLYGSSLPVRVSMVDFPSSGALSMRLRYIDENTVELNHMVSYVGGKPIKINETVVINYRDTVNTPVGRLCINPTVAFNTGDEDVAPFKVINYSYTTLHSAATNYSKRLSVALSNKESSAISLDFKDASAQRAVDVLNTLIDVYNERWIADRNIMAVSTSEFINERLMVIEHELGAVDSHISQFKSSTGLIDPEAVGSLYLTRSSKLETDLLDLYNRMEIAKYMSEYLRKNAGAHDILPANSGMDNVAIEQEISSYNTSMIKRNRLVANSSEQNPIVVDMDASLALTRSSIIAAVDNYIATLNTEIAAMEKQSMQNTRKISSNPMQIRDLTDVERQQKVKEALYLYLLEKREENELSQAFTAYNTRVLATPLSSHLPIAPKRMQILLIALLAGLALPAGILYMKKMMDTKLRTRKDLEGLETPFLGELPLAYKHRRFESFRKPQDKDGTIVVKHGSRNVVNEAFRVVRANLELICAQYQCPVIQTLSFNVSSGKTFTAMNLATSLAIKGKKVCAIDLDIRKGTLSAYVGTPSKGITEYLVGKIDDINKVIVKAPSSSNLDVIPVGSLPPNPSELLYSERLDNLIAELKTRYDYIFMDSTPANIVADAAIVNRLVDRTIMLVRAGLLEKELLPEIDEYYKKSTYKGLVVLLNGTEMSARYGYGKRYGYGYGYGYGHGYGYGYHSNSDDEEAYGNKAK